MGTVYIMFMNSIKTNFLYHYYERSFGPFRPLTALPMEEVRQILLEQCKVGKFRNPDVEGFLRKRYDREPISFLKTQER